MRPGRHAAGLQLLCALCALLLPLAASTVIDDQLNRVEMRLLEKLNHHDTTRLHVSHQHQYNQHQEGFRPSDSTSHHVVSHATTLFAGARRAHAVQGGQRAVAIHVHASRVPL